MIYGFANAKGGVGKTTIAVHLACWLHRKGDAVAFVDCDSLCSSSSWLAEANPQIHVEKAVEPDQLVALLPKLRKRFENIVIDGPAGLSPITRTIMIRADAVLLPCGPSLIDLRAASDAVNSLKEARKVREGAPKAALVPNRIGARQRLSREMLSAAGTLGIEVLEGLHQRQAFPEAATQGTTVWDLGRSAGLAAKEMTDLAGSIADV